MSDAIKVFEGEFRFLSNYSYSPITIEKQLYPTVEHAFAACKTLDITMKMAIANAPTPGKAKALGRKVLLRKNWDSIKFAVMEYLIILKFKDPDLRSKLLATGDRELIEGNTWGDKIWGIDLKTGIGDNNLGKILMKVRTHYHENK
jgi:ribA/ribD-fused uncharacterized protein